MAETPSPETPLVHRLMDKIRELEHQVYALNDSPIMASRKSMYDFKDIVKRPKEIFDTGLAYILGEDLSLLGETSGEDVGELVSDLQAKLAAAKAKVEDDAVHILRLTTQLEERSLAAERQIAELEAAHTAEIEQVRAASAAELEDQANERLAERRQGAELALQQAQAATDAAKKQADDHGRTAERLNAYVAELESAQAVLTQELEAAKSALVAARREAAAAGDETDALRTQRGALMQELNETRARLQRAMSSADEFHARFLQERVERRQVHEELQALRGNIRVLCRVRPRLTPGATSALDIPLPGSIRVCTPEGRAQEFEFGTVAGETVTQAELFEEVAPLARSVADGHNVCIFAYGQTGAGKTHTMLGTPADPGLGVRAFSALASLADAPGAERPCLHGAMLEVYMDTVRDLAVGEEPGSGFPGNLAPGANLDVCGLPPGMLGNWAERVPALSWHPLATDADLLALLRRGAAGRATAATALNAASSRSHAVLAIRASDPEGKLPSSFLHIVDLAGSERVARSEVSGQQLKEAQAINKSLSALGDVIAALAGRAGHVPYRNSRLTQVLQDSLAGTSKTLLVCCLSPEPESAQETLSSLGFASPAKDETAALRRSLGDRTPLNDRLNTPPPSRLRA